MMRDSAKGEMNPKAEQERDGFPSIESLLPHRGPASLLDRVLGHSEVETACLIRLDTQTFLTHVDGSVGSWVALEYMAQAVAAHEGLLAYYDGRALPLGFLVAVSKLRLHEASFESEDRLIVRARRVRGRPELGALSHQCSLDLVRESALADDRLLVGGASPGVRVAEGRISVSIPRPKTT